MRHYETGNRVSTPFDHFHGAEGVNVRFSGSNLEPDEYRELLPPFIAELIQGAAISVDGAQFTGSVHEMSNLTAHERYIRIDRDWSTQVVGPNGALYRLFQLCASRTGNNCEYRADDDGIVGHNHRLILPEDNAERVLSRHAYGKQIKHYHPKRVRRSDTNDPLAHPKLCVLVKSSLNMGAVDWEDRDIIRREIDETLVNLLYWSDVPVNVDGTTYVADQHFPAEPAAEPVELVADPTPVQEAKQELLLADVLRDLCESDIEVLETLIDDSGGQHPAQIARKTGRAQSTIYRALKRLSGIVENDNGDVSLASRKFQQELGGILESPASKIGDPAKRAAEILGFDLCHTNSSAWQRWCQTYVGKLAEITNGADAVLRIDTVLSRLKSSSKPRLESVLREAIQAWKTAGNDPLELWRAKIR